MTLPHPLRLAQCVILQPILLLGFGEDGSKAGVMELPLLITHPLGNDYLKNPRLPML